MIRYLMIATACLGLAATTAAAQGVKADGGKPHGNAAERAAVKAAVLDYVEALYDVDPSRVAKSVHPELQKRGYSRDRASGVYADSKMTYAQLEALAARWNSSKKLPKDAPKDIEVFDVLDQIATAKLTAQWGVDYFHLAKYDGKWKIVNILWQTPPVKH